MLSGCKINVLSVKSHLDQSYGKHFYMNRKAIDNLKVGERRKINIINSRTGTTGKALITGLADNSTGGDAYGSFLGDPVRAAADQWQPGDKVILMSDCSRSNWHALAPWYDYMKEIELQREYIFVTMHEILRHFFFRVLLGIDKQVWKEICLTKRKYEQFCQKILPVFFRQTIILV